MSRLIVVSNRVAPIRQDQGNVGGLAVAVLAALRESGGIWFGWSGQVVPTPTDRPHIQQVGKMTYANVDLNQRDYDQYYNGFANSTLWPLLHYRLDLTTFDRHNFAGYQRVNGMFASKLTPMVEPDDLVWVHDYHLIPVGEELRRAGLNNRMGFFLHTPFPALEVMTAMPAHESLVRSICAYDVVGFQTESDLRAFWDYIVLEAGGDVLDNRMVQAYGRTIRADVFPISIDTEILAEQAKTAWDTRQNERLRQSLVGRDLIVGVDRLDYSKGLPERFEAFERLLENYPSNRGCVTFMQIAPPSRSDVAEYAEIRHTLETAAGHINGRFAEFDWVPIRYLNKSFNRRNLAGFYRVARIGLVTPLRDGMNLVAKEYVAAQNPDDPGVLVLSRFAGAARELDSALVVNPYDIEGVAEALERGLQMPKSERIERWSVMFDHIKKHDIAAWRTDFVRNLEAAPYTASYV